jgi:hypothetical protein
VQRGPADHRALPGHGRRCGACRGKGGWRRDWVKPREDRKKGRK